MGLAVADLDDDGWLDAAVGAPDPYRSPEPNAAAVIVLRGGPGALSIDRSTQLTPPSPDQPWFGYQFETGDVNGDGSTDLVDATGGWAPGPLHEATTATAFGAGGTLTVGDVTADGVDDVVIGHMRGAGAITVHAGTGSGPATGVTYTQDSPGFPGHAEPSDRFGFSVGLLRGPDGRVDLLVGSREENVGGTVDVLSTGPSGLASNGAVRLSEDRVGVPGRSRRHEHFGLILQVLDLNGRGRPELIVRTRKRIPASITGERVGYEGLRLIFFHPMRDGAVWRLRDQDVPNGWS
jgi:hypothetical protein